MIKLLFVLLTTQFVIAPADDNSGHFATGSIYGLWKGTFTVSDGSTGTFYFSIKPDHQLLIENYHNGVQRIANGTWKLKGKIFTCTGKYFYGHSSNIGTITTHRAIFNGTDKLEKGVWKNLQPNDDTGGFSLRKIK